MGSPDGSHAELLRAYPALIVFFRARLPKEHRDEAEDLAHDSLLAAHAALAATGISTVQDLRSYVLGIARHKLDDWLRGRYRNREDPWPDEILDGFIEELRAVSAEQRVLEHERRDRLHRALARLSDLERELLRLRYREGMGHDEACRALGISPKKGSHLKHRALRKLRFRLRILREIPPRRPTSSSDEHHGPVYARERQRSTERAR